MRIVVALGGNALDAPTREERVAAMLVAAAEIADLVAAGHEVVVTHGNGPQVGALLLDQEARAERPGVGIGRDHATPHVAGTPLPVPLPLDTLVAMTQAQLGYRIQQTLDAQLRARGLAHRCVTVVTQVRVASDDPALSRATKPIGPSHDDRPDDGRVYARTSGGRWRRVVPSPTPVEIIEVEAISALLVARIVPVCAGGGGVPVTRVENGWHGIEAVVDKDATSALLASDLDADALVILTDVAAVELDHGTPQARPVAVLTVDEVAALVASGAVREGSMGPKVRAAARAAAEGRIAVIAALGSAVSALAGSAGTRIVRAHSTEVA